MNHSAKKTETYVMEERLSMHNQPYFGEIGSNLIMMEILVKLYDNNEKKKHIIDFLQGKDVDELVEVLLESKIKNWREYRSFLSDLDHRTTTCMAKVVDNFDSTIFFTKKSVAFDPIHVINKERECRERMLYGTQFQNLDQIVNTRKPLPLKLKLIREAMESRWIRSVLNCMAQIPADIERIYLLTQNLFTLCPANQLTNDDKQCYLNANLAVHYKCPDLTQKLISFEAAQEYSFSLAQSGSLHPDPYFYYMITHWPNENDDKKNNTEYLESYDENTLSNCINKMRRLADDKSILFIEQNVKYEKKVNHRPLYLPNQGERI